MNNATKKYDLGEYTHMLKYVLDFKTYLNNDIMRTVLFYIFYPMKLKIKL